MHWATRHIGMGIHVKSHRRVAISIHACLWRQARVHCYFDSVEIFLRHAATVQSVNKISQRECVEVCWRVVA